MKRIVIRYHPSGLLATRRTYGIRDRLGFTLFAIAFIGVVASMVGVAWLLLAVCFK